MENLITTQINELAVRFDLPQSEELYSVLKATAFKGEVSDAQLSALLIVANQYGLNPWTKEIYAFPDKKNGIIPVVSVDGWARIINSHPKFDGMDFNFSADMVQMDGARSQAPAWTECVMHRKDRSHPTVIREYLDEVYRAPFKANGNNGPYTVEGPWQTHPKRFSRHKAMIQCARMAFGFGGIYDQDEAERIAESMPLKSIDTATGETKPAAPAFYSKEDFAKNLPAWQKVITSGRKTAEDIISMAQTKHPLTEDQKAAVRKAPVAEDATPAVVAQAPAAVTAVSYTYVADALHKAANMDELDLAADLIGEVTDATQRRALTETYDARRVELI